MSGVVTQNVGRPSGLIKAVAAGGGTWVEIKSLTASGDATLDFEDGTSDVVLDSTYPVYCFRFSNIHPATDSAYLQFQGNVAGGSGYNETIQSAVWVSYNNEGGSDAAIYYATGQDQQNATGYQYFTGSGATGNDNDQCISGNLYLFGPSGTTYVTHFLGTTCTNTGEATASASYALQSFIAGYFNLTGAVDEISFKFSSGTIDAGKIKLFGIKDS